MGLGDAEVSITTTYVLPPTTVECHVPEDAQRISSDTTCSGPNRSRPWLRFAIIHRPTLRYEQANWLQRATGSGTTQKRYVLYAPADDVSVPKMTRPAETPVTNPRVTGISQISHHRKLATSIVRPLPSCQHGYPRCSKPQEQRNRVDRLTTSTPMCHSGCMRPDHMQICG